MVKKPDNSFLTTWDDRLDSIDEFEREPVPEKELKGWRGFLGMYAGEHTAGTEFVIGALFVPYRRTRSGWRKERVARMERVARKEQEVRKERVVRKERIARKVQAE